MAPLVVAFFLKTDVLSGSGERLGLTQDALRLKKQIRIYTNFLGLFAKIRTIRVESTLKSYVLRKSYRLIQLYETFACSR